MNRPVVAGYDGTPESRDALALTRLLATALDAPVLVLSVLTAAPLEVDWRTYAAELREQSERLQAEAREALAGLADVETIGVPAPSPPRELNRLAYEREAKVVVLGSTHRGPLGRILPGTVADRLLSGGSCPVAMAPRGFSEREARFASIGVGFDGSPESRLALAEAGAVAQATGASISVVGVVDPSFSVEVAAAARGYAGLVASPRLTREQVDHMRSIAQSAIRDLAPEVATTIEVREGEPAAVLSELSERFDLLALGSRGYGPLSRVLLGSVSSAVLRGSRCPVLVTPRAEISETAQRPANGVGEISDAATTASAN